MTDRLRRLFVHSHWANREVLRSLLGATPAPDGACRVLAHVLGGERLWLHRIGAWDAQPIVWPPPDLASMGAGFDEVRELWLQMLGFLGVDGLAQTIDYKNSEGVSWTNTVEDILLHVIEHSAYHRGQVATLLREAGQEAANTDYIHAVRSGFV